MTREAFADLTLAAFTDRLAGAAASPGSGAAAAVVLALAGGCLAKAAAITLKHGADRELAEMGEAARALSRAALGGADEESHAFRRMLRRSPEGAAESLEVGEGLLTTAEGLRALLPRMRPHVHAAVVGDLTAAEALLAAAERIWLANQAEAALAEPGPGR